MKERMEDINTTAEELKLSTTYMIRYIEDLGYAEKPQPTIFYCFTTFRSVVDNNDGTKSFYFTDEFDEEMVEYNLTHFVEVADFGSTIQ